MFLSGFFHALILLVLSAINIVEMKIFISVYHADPVMIACVASVGAGLVLSIYAGPGRLVSSSFKNSATWLFGLCGLGNFIIDMVLAKYVGAAEMSLISRVAIPLSMIAAYVFFKHKPSKIDFIGAVVVSIAITLLMVIQNVDMRWTITILTIVIGWLFVGEYMFAESHSESGKAQETGSIRDKARVVGFVTFITSILFLILAFIISYLNTNYFNGNPPVYLSFIPVLEQFITFKSVIFGIAFGIMNLALYNYCLFAATYRMKSENVFALEVFVPVLTIILERFMAIFYPELHVNLFGSTYGQILLFITFIMTIGSGIPIFYKFKKEADKNPEKTFWDVIKTSFGSEKEEITMTSSAEGDYEIVKQTLGYTNGDYKKAAELLKITADAIKILEGGRGAYALKDEASVMIQKNYQENIKVLLV